MERLHEFYKKALVFEMHSNKRNLFYLEKVNEVFEKIKKKFEKYNKFLLFLRHLNCYQNIMNLTIDILKKFCHLVQLIDKNFTDVKKKRA
jgi:hypothetical protein